MSDYHVDGTLTVAKLKRNVPGGALFTDIAIRREDGAMVTAGTMRVTTPMLGAMVPGTRGRFYFHDVAGTKGMHGFRGGDGAGRFHFPTLFIWFGFLIGPLNLAMVAWWYLSEGSIRPFAFFFGMFGIVIGILFAAAREGARRRFRADATAARRPQHRPALA